MILTNRINVIVSFKHSKNTPLLTPTANKFKFFQSYHVCHPRHLNRALRHLCACCNAYQTHFDSPALVLAWSVRLALPVTVCQCRHVRPFNTSVANKPADTGHFLQVKTMKNQSENARFKRKMTLKKKTRNGFSRKD